jgi:hypothetical protein
MSRKVAVIMIAIIVAVAFVATVAIAGDPPAKVTIDKGADKKSGVAFDHAKHAGTFDCVKCHHTSKSKDDVQSCFECHGADSSAPDVKDAFHGLCLACHRADKKGPTKCKECHP